MYDKTWINKLRLTQNLQSALWVREKSIISRLIEHPEFYEFRPDIGLLSEIMVSFWKSTLFFNHFLNVLRIIYV